MATKEGIIEVDGLYFYFSGDLPMPYENSVEVTPVKRGVVKETIWGYDSMSTERIEWAVFKDVDGNYYSTREGKAWVRESDKLKYEEEEDIVEIEFFEHDEPKSLEDEHEFARKELDI